MNRAHVLIIEDVADIRDTLRDVLELSGYRVRTAENGEVGLRMIAQPDLPCLILLDLMMPVMDGWQVLEALRGPQAAVVASIPVIVLSGVADRAEVGNLQRRFGCKVMSKPADIDRLLEAVEGECAPGQAFESG
ncbi:response regulator [Methylibium sp.]|uniref:response regulator n=1 Tax=Methylibium sp. TaxID=2067992 RepID=UPI0018379318|nr:response regulator [Methylibium sp.]MBA3588426.1 response regulator [Methylibium sp.]